MRIYHLEWRGKRLAVQAIVEPERVRIFSVRESAPLRPREADPELERRARKGEARVLAGQTYHGGEDPGEGGNATALSAWSAEDRVALMNLVRRASELTDGTVTGE